MTGGSSRQRQQGLRILLQPERVEARLWAKRGPDAEGEKASRALFGHHRLFAEKISRQQFARRAANNYELADITQLAYEALIQSISRYDPDRGTPFEAYSRRRILGHISNGLAKFSESAARYSYSKRAERERIRSIKNATDRLSPIDPITALSELSAEIALGLLLEQNGIEAAEAIPDPSPSAYETLAWNELIKQAHRQLEKLPEREAFVIRQHYQNGVSFREIAALLKISKGRVSQLHKSALQRIRGQMGKIG